MAEIRLICPGCDAEYRIPEKAIPPEGREVECSDCGRVWHGERPARTAEPMDLSRFSVAESEAPVPQARVQPPRRRVPDNVLSILREEVEHERRARFHEDGLESRPAAAQEPAGAGPGAAERGDPDWPATTVTAVQRNATADPAAQIPAARSAQDIPTIATAPATAAPEVTKSSAATADGRPQPAVQANPTQPRRSGYGMGFGLSAMIAASVVALYLLAPPMADAGPFGAFLMDLREGLDRARLWLQDRASALFA